MADFLVDLTGDRVPEVKIVLTVVVVVLGVYQLALMAVGYGKVRVPFLSARAASFSHRTIGDAIAPVTLVVAIMCLGYFGLRESVDEAVLHALLGVALAVVLALKVATVRGWLPWDRFLPHLGMSVFTLLALTAVTGIGG